MSLPCSSPTSKSPWLDWLHRSGPVLLVGLGIVIFLGLVAVASLGFVGVFSGATLERADLTVAITAVRLTDALAVAEPPAPAADPLAPVAFQSSQLRIWVLVSDPASSLVNLALAVSTDNGPYRLLRLVDSTGLRVSASPEGVWTSVVWNAEPDLGFHANRAVLHVVATTVPAAPADPALPPPLPVSSQVVVVELVVPRATYLRNKLQRYANFFVLCQASAHRGLLAVCMGRVE